MFLIVHKFCGMVCLWTSTDKYLERFFRGFSYLCVIPLTENLLTVKSFS